MSSLPYDIAAFTRACAASGRALRPGDRFVATLVESPGEEALRRLDFCAESWDGGARPTPPLRVFAVWRTTVPERDAPQGPVLNPADLLDLLEQLEGTTEPQAQTLRYLVALQLLRKRLVNFEGQRPATAADAGGEAGPGGTVRKGLQVLLLRRRTPAGQAPGPLYEVLDPALDDSAVAAAAAQPASILPMEEDGPASASAGGGGRA